MNILFFLLFNILSQILVLLAYIIFLILGGQSNGQYKRARPGGHSRPGRHYWRIQALQVKTSKQDQLGDDWRNQINQRNLGNLLK